MECYYHPNKEGVNTCAICGKSVCEECSLEIAGKMYCKECLEKIVGIGLNNKNNEENETQSTDAQIETKTEPVRLGKKEEPQKVPINPNYQPQKEEKTVFASDLSNKLTNENNSIYDNLTKEEYTYNAPSEPEYYPKEEIVKKPIADDSPYNIKGMSYSEEYEQKPKNTPYLEQSTINQELSQGTNTYQQPQSAQNEFDYYSQEQISQQPQQDYIYPDHTYEPAQTSARQALEEKYEKYLDDLYFDEPEIPLDEQLAKDEAEYGSLTKKPYIPPTPQPVEEYIEENAYPQQLEQSYYQQTPQPKTPHRSYEEEQELDRQIRSQLNIRREEPENTGKLIHNIKYDDGKEPYGVVDIILTIILIIAILVVLFYIIYLFFLSSSYPTFIDAIFGLQNPGELLSKLMK